MKNIVWIVSAAVAAAFLSACGNSSPVGLVDVSRIVGNWTEYEQYQAQLLSDEQKIASSRISAANKQRQAVQLQQRYGKITDQLTQQIRDAAGKIARQRKLELVLTRIGVGYGGVDITRDVEKALNITEKPSPSPSP